MTTKTWFITGTSRGFGREWAIAALERGDRVAATARHIDTLSDLADTYGEALLPLQLDVTHHADVNAAVARAHDVFGGLDVVINNAGYGLFGFVEEITEHEARAQLDTNVLGPLFVTHAALPFLRAQGSGHIIQVSSIGGITAFPGLGLYHASKWALEGFTQSLAAEVAGFGIHVTLVEPGGFATDWSGASAVHADPNPAYDTLRAQIAEHRRTNVGPGGDPTATRAAILAVVDAPQPPLRFFLGATPLATATAEYAKRLAEWEAWQPVSLAAQGN